MNPADNYTPEALAAATPEELCADWLQAKTAEEKCKAWRVAVEEALDAILGHKPEGSKTHAVEDFKVEITGVLNRKLDKEKWEEVKGQIPEELRPVRMKPEVDPTGCKWLQKNRPDVWAIAAQAITVTPGKTGVKITKKEEG
jgi:hypothetical protein